ncbi:MAG: TRAP transporter substrate-binding protein [Spirochaetes bacterium]|jgi:TRAP-type uncharacterized transport system substrate-binding protein|nr:TRAP transporter substrate-binding protein [Spirochaetota bacterium]
MKSKRIAFALVLFLVLATFAMAGGAGEARTDVRWGTSSTGSSGHAALTALTSVLNREMSDYIFTVLPTPGAVFSMTEYANGQSDAFYGANVGFLEYGQQRDRFAEFDYDAAERELVQTFWAFTLEVGLAVQGNRFDDLSEWRDLDGEVIFTGPAPWDVRAALRYPLQEVLNMDYSYEEIDLDMVATSLDAGHVDAINAYTSSESTVPGWLLEAQLRTDIQILNPSDEEVRILNEAGVEVVDVDPAVFETDLAVDTIKRIPFFYGFHTGPDVMSAEDVYEMLTVIYENTGDLRDQNASYAQIDEDMVGMQVRGINSSVEYVKIHPGTKMFLEEHGAWDPAWDDRVAE